MIYKDKKINLKNLSIYIVLLVLFFKTSCYTSFSNTFSSIITLLSVFFSLIIYGIYIFKRKFSKFILIFLAYCFFLMISCYLGKYSQVTDMIKLYFPILSIMFLLDLYLKKDCKSILLVLENVLLTLIFLNTLTLLFYPNGLYADGYYSNNWLFMYDNMHIFMFFPALATSYICKEYRQKRVDIKFILLLIMTTFSVYKCFSVNTVVTYTLFLLFLIFRNVFNKISFLNARKYLIFTLFIFFGIVVFRLQYLFTYFLEGILNRDLTFTGRTIIWDNVLFYIKKRWFLGYGIEPTTIFANKMGEMHYTHAHNTIYDCLYKGGIVSLFLFASLIFICIKKLQKNRKEIISKMIAFIILCLFIMMMFESRQEKIGLYIVLLFCYYIDSIIKSLNKTKADDTNESN